MTDTLTLVRCPDCGAAIGQPCRGHPLPDIPGVDPQSVSTYCRARIDALLGEPN